MASTKKEMKKIFVENEHCEIFGLTEIKLTNTRLAQISATINRMEGAKLTFRGNGDDNDQHYLSQWAVRTWEGARVAEGGQWVVSGWSEGGQCPVVSSYTDIHSPKWSIQLNINTMRV